MTDDGVVGIGAVHRSAACYYGYYIPDYPYTEFLRLFLKLSDGNSRFMGLEFLRDGELVGDMIGLEFWKEPENLAIEFCLMRCVFACAPSLSLSLASCNASICLCM